MIRIHWFALGVLALAPASVDAQTTELGRSLVQLVDTVVTTNKQRKVLLELMAPLAFEPGAGPIDPTNRNDPRNLDIAGVRLGMTVRQAQAALRTAGYVDAGPRDTQYSYAASVVYDWKTTFGYKGNLVEHVEKELQWDKGEERIVVKLIALPEGPRVNAVEYAARDGAPISTPEFTRRVLAKYGDPVNDDPNEFRWCVVKAPDCEPPNEARFPVLSAWPHARQLELLGSDSGRDEALAKRFAADVDRRKPADQVPAF